MPCWCRSIPNFIGREAGALHRDLVRRTVEWLLGEMRVGDTAFASTLAAESEGREGAYYLLDPAEVASVLGDAAHEFRAQYLASSADFEGGKVLNRFGEASRERNQASFLAHCDRLLAARRRRPRPERDEKIVADWNGLAIAALVQAAVVFDEPRWLEEARAAFAFVADAMTVGDTLHHAWNGGQLGAPGVLDDYANMSLAALRLLEATGEAQYLQQAAAWTKSCDTVAGGRSTVMPIADARHEVPNVVGGMKKAAARVGEMSWRACSRSFSCRRVTRFTDGPHRNCSSRSRPISNGMASCSRASSMLRSSTLGQFK
jgi:hypothetical protein